MQDLGIINFLAYLYYMCLSVRKHVWALSFFQYFKWSFALILHFRPSDAKKG